MKQYLALTLGPITRVISLAKTTRGMWAASYLFSYLAKHIIEPFKDRQFLLPFLDDELFYGHFEGVGVFPDRYIFEATNEDFEALAKQSDNVMNMLASKIATNDEEKEKIRMMLLQYFKVYFFLTERRENEKGEEEKDRDIVERCEKQLALLEQHDSFIPSVAHHEHYLSKLINSENLAPMKFLLDDAQIGKFKSIVNVSTGNDGKGYNIDINKLKPYERYIAIVNADGDSMGEAFSTADNSKELSRKLFLFTKKAVETINDFDGQPIYIGGDDLFFFAPIYNPRRKSIFSLLSSLDEAFHKELGASCPATLSFGVSITYCKYPMSEAVKNSRELLDLAKPKGTDVYKNNVLFSLQKHSGQTRSALLHKGCIETVQKMNNLIDNYIVGGNKDDLQLVSSAMHNLREHEPVLLNAIEDKTLLTNYFKNNYNEPVHDSFKGFFNDVCSFLYIAYTEFVDKIDKLKRSLETPIKGRTSGHDAAYAALDLCYSTLQFIHLVNDNRNE